MTNNLMELFSTNSANNMSQASRTLTKTNELVALSTTIANAVINAAQTDIETNGQLITASQRSIEALDQLIQANYDLKVVDIEFLKTEDYETLEKMMKSQQSKKSRSKSNVMTLDNYTTMMSAAVAELLLRLAMNKPKGSITHTSSAEGISSYSEEEYQALADNQEALAKAIRNVQSKKSIAKSKAVFDPSSALWQSLLETEARLKSLRMAPAGSTIKVKKADQIESLLDNLDLETVKASDAKTLLAKINELIKG